MEHFSGISTVSSTLIKNETIIIIIQQDFYAHVWVPYAIKKLNKGVTVFDLSFWSAVGKMYPSAILHWMNQNENT